MARRINSGLRLLSPTRWEATLPLVTSQQANLKGSKHCQFDDRPRFKVRKTLAGLDLHIAEPLLPCSWRIWWCARRARSRSPALLVQTGHRPPCSGQRTSPSDGPASTVASRPGQTCMHVRTHKTDSMRHVLVSQLRYGLLNKLEGCKAKVKVHGQLNVPLFDHKWQLSNQTNGGDSQDVAQHILG